MLVSEVRGQITISRITACGFQLLLLLGSPLAPPRLNRRLYLPRNLRAGPPDSLVRSPQRSPRGSRHLNPLRCLPGNLPGSPHLSRRVCPARSPPFLPRRSRPPNPLDLPLPSLQRSRQVRPLDSPLPALQVNLPRSPPALPRRSLQAGRHRSPRPSLPANPQGSLLLPQPAMWAVLTSKIRMC